MESGATFWESDFDHIHRFQNLLNNNVLMFKKNYNQLDLDLSYSYQPDTRIAVIHSSHGWYIAKFTVLYIEVNEQISYSTRR